MPNPTPATAPKIVPKVPKTDMRPQPWIMLGIVLVIGLALGYGAGRLTVGTTSVAKGTYQDGYDAARAKLKASGVFPPTQTETKLLSGQIKSVGDSSFVLTTDLRSPNPLEPLTVPPDRTVTLASGGQVVRQTQLSSEEFQKQMQEFQKTVNSGQPTPPPSPYKIEDIALKDLKVGDEVTVEADHDIMPEASFAATKVVMSGSTIAPLAPAPATSAPAPVTQPTPTPAP